MKECCGYTSPCHLPRRDPWRSLWVSGFFLLHDHFLGTAGHVCGSWGGGAFLLLLRGLEALYWELFWEKNKFLMNTFWKLLSSQIRTDQKMVSFLKNEASVSPALWHTACSRWTSQLSSVLGPLVWGTPGAECHWREKREFGTSLGPGFLT